MKVIFLDIDGVLNNNKTRVTTSDGWLFVDDNLIKNLKFLIDLTDAKIVLSSTWRDGWITNNPDNWDISFIELTTKFKQFGLSFYGKTGAWQHNRGLEIQSWLDAHPEVENYVIIDDWPDMGELIHRLILTDPIEGLTEEKINEAYLLLNNKTDKITLKDLIRTTPHINKRTKPITITFRSHYAGQDIFTGSCAWDRTKLISYDGDNYSLEDVIESYWRDPLTDDLTVWQKGE